MQFRRTTLSLAVACLFGCHTYTADPVNLDEHILLFQQREKIAQRTEGLSRADAREMAKMLHPDARLARRRAGIATTKRDNAGRWMDPQLQTNLQRILESVPHQWISTAQLGFTVPINGRLQKARELADRQREEALVDAWATEQRVANELDTSWVTWSSSVRRKDLFETTCDNLEQLEAIADALVETSGLSKPSARVFTLERLQKEASHAMAISEERVARLNVLRHIGLHPEALLLMQADLKVKPFVEPPLARQQAIQGSPRLIAKRLEHATAEADLHLQVRKQWPDLQLWPGWQEEDGHPRAAFGINLPLPIFTGNDPAIAKATATRDLKAEALRASIEQLLQELAIAELRHDAAIEQAHRIGEILVLAKRQLVDNRRLAAAGQFDPLLMLDALLRQHQAQMQVIETEKTAALATITINDLLPDPESKTPVTDNGAEQ